MHEFDGSLRDAFQSVCGLVLDDDQWEQASLRVKQSGLGLTRAADVADVAYLASRDTTFDDCLAMDRRHAWDDGSPGEQRQDEVIGEWLGNCVRRVNGALPEQSRFGLGSRPVGTIKQGLLMDVVNKGRRDGLVNKAGLWGKARLEAASAPRSGSWLDALPNPALNTQLSNAEVQYGVGRRLGVELCEECPCPFCLGVMDRFGAHCESCMSGGDKTVNHSKIRDDIYIHAKKAHTLPRLEACGVTRLLGLEGGVDGRERPADVLLCRAQDIRTGVGEGAGKVALDVGIVCPQAAGHLGDAAAGPLGAAEEYVKAKCARGDMERRCREAGVVFQPMIFESMGGVSVEAERVLKSLNKAVAVNSDASEVKVATHFWQRIGVDILRGCCRSFHRRLVGKGRGEGERGYPFRGLGGLVIAGGV